VQAVRSAFTTRGDEAARSGHFSGMDCDPGCARTCARSRCVGAELVVTVRAMTHTDDEAAAQAADAMQAASLRESLCIERAKLCSEIAERQHYIERRATRVTSHTQQRLGSRLRSVEAQVRHVDRLIAQLDRRFGHQRRG
jgi:hypothetical protein